jgi:DNA-damage-inducible protein D
MGVPDNRPVADFLPTISIKAKDLAAEMTGLNVQNKDLKGQDPIEKEHIENSAAVRNMLVKRGIHPEQLAPADDIKKIQRKLDTDDKNVLKEVKKAGRKKK